MMKLKFTKNLKRDVNIYFDAQNGGGFKKTNKIEVIKHR